MPLSSREPKHSNRTLEFVALHGNTLVEQARTPDDGDTEVTSLKQNSRKSGFTLVELMIVVLIIGILLAVAVPQWIGARERSRRSSCVSNIRLIDHAKEQFAMETGLINGAPCTMADIYPDYIGRTMSRPECHSGGNYTVGNIGETPTCSYIVGNYPHIYP